MGKSLSKMPLPKLDDLFTTEEERNIASLEKVVDIKITDIDDFPNHPFKVIDKVVNGKMTRKEAQFELDKSRQQIYRLILIYLNEGKEGFIHKNRGKVSKNKIDKNIIEELEQLYLNEYYDYNFEHFFEG